MKSFWIKLKSLIITYLYLILDKLGFSKNNAFILMFHHVTNEQIDVSSDCKCSVEHFSKVMDYLKNNRIKVVSMNEALVNIDKGMLKGYAVITFDDGIDDTYKIAYPLLKIYNFPFTVYLTLHYLNNERHLTFEQLEILNKDPFCTIGAHTLTHPVLNTALDSKIEIIQSKQRLENLLEKEVLHFAYPYGGPSTVSIKNIFDTKDARYRSAVSSVGARLNYFSTITKFYLPRVNGSLFLSSNKV